MCCLLFFLYITNLLDGVCRQTMVATFITTYTRMKLHEKQKEKRKEKEKREKRKKKKMKNKKKRK